MSSYTNKPIEVLLVDDDIGDVFLTKETLEETKVKVNLSVVYDGVEAMLYLRKQGEYSNVTQPDLILLDLNMPKKDGRQVLDDIKNDINLKMIPIVVLTTSDAETDIAKSYALGANCYITKPVGLEQFSEVVKAIDNFWFTIVKLPSSK